MMSAPAKPLTCAALWVLFSLFIAFESDALTKPDSDQPFSAALGFETQVDGNPLEKGDEIYTLQGSYRLFRGDLGFGASLGYAQPSSDLVPRSNEKLELLLLDFSVIWYANYRHQERYWQRAMDGGSRIKPELVLFGGPGFASLRIKDEHPGSQFSDAVDDFFTVNAGVGVRFFRYQGDDRTTSRWFVFPKAQARWFAGDENTIDWGVGLSVGVSFGSRPSRRALDLVVRKSCDYVAGVYPATQEAGERGTEELRVSCAMAVRERDELEELRGRVALCGARCEHLRCIETAVETVRDSVAALGCDDGPADRTRRHLNARD